jgi:hypothetical protein
LPVQARAGTGAQGADVTSLFGISCQLFSLLWAWEADAEFDEEPGEEWLTLRKDKFNEQVWYGWRLDPRELVARQPGAARTPEAQRGARRGGCEAP